MKFGLFTYFKPFNFNSTKNIYSETLFFSSVQVKINTKTELLQQVKIVIHDSKTRAIPKARAEAFAGKASSTSNVALQTCGTQDWISFHAAANP